MQEQEKRSAWLRIGLSFVFLLLLHIPTEAHAFITINEILADPASGLAGDSNGDGITSSTQDEFVEILNYSDNPLDISGWTLADSVQNRHVFLPNTILMPYEFIVVFGGGTPNLTSVNFQVATTGGLSLNNTADTIRLFDFNSSLMDQVVYGSLANGDQSIVRNPDGLGQAFVLHAQAPNANGRLFSAGQRIDGSQFPQPEVPPTATIPEIPSLIYLLSGMTPFLFRKN